MKKLGFGFMRLPLLENGNIDNVMNGDLDEMIEALRIADQTAKLEAEMEE